MEGEGEWELVEWMGEEKEERQGERDGERERDGEEQEMERGERDPRLSMEELEEKDLEEQ